MPAGPGADAAAAAAAAAATAAAVLTLPPARAAAKRARPESAADAVAKLHLEQAANLKHPRGAHIKTWLTSGKGKAKGLPAAAAVCEHHGIYVSDDEVIHFTRDHAVAGYSNDPVVEVTTLAGFGFPNTTVAAPAGWQEAEDVVARARGEIGQSNYDLLGNNCEHFATWCRTGKRESEQVSSAAAHSVAAGLPGAGVGGAVGAALGTSTTVVSTVAPGGAVCLAQGGTAVSAGAVGIGIASGLLVGGLLGGVVWAALRHFEAEDCGGRDARSSPPRQRPAGAGDGGAGDAGTPQ